MGRWQCPLLGRWLTTQVAQYASAGTKPYKLYRCTGSSPASHCRLLTHALSRLFHDRDNIAEFDSRNSDWYGFV